MSAHPDKAAPCVGPLPMPRPLPAHGWYLEARGGSNDKYVVRSYKGGWGLICTLHSGPQNRRGEEARQAGLLLAAAPDLLAAAVDAEYALTAVIEFSFDYDDGPDVLCAAEELCGERLCSAGGCLKDKLAAMRAVIAKATGAPS